MKLICLQSELNVASIRICMDTFLKIIFTGAGFSNIPGKYENVIFIIKNL